MSSTSHVLFQQINQHGCKCGTRPAIKFKFRAKSLPLSHHKKDWNWSERSSSEPLMISGYQQSDECVFSRVHLLFSAGQSVVVGGGPPLEAECAVADMMCNRCEAVREETITAVSAVPGHALPICPLMSHQAESLA